jgi:hypothetical protein
MLLCSTILLVVLVVEVELELVWFWWSELHIPPPLLTLPHYRLYPITNFTPLPTLPHYRLYPITNFTPLPTLPHYQLYPMTYVKRWYKNANMNNTSPPLTHLHSQPIKQMQCFEVEGMLNCPPFCPSEGHHYTAFNCHHVLGSLINMRLWSTQFCWLCIFTSIK